MKRFFTLMAAMLVCVSGMLAAVAYTLEVVAPEHATITSIQINNAEWTGGTVEADDTLTVSLQAEPLYEFGEGTGNTTLTFDTVLSSDLADDDAKFTITCTAPTIMQVYFVHFNGGWHYHLDSVWVNGAPMLENDFMVGDGDYVQYRYRADEGYEFAEDITTYQSGFTPNPSPMYAYGDTIRIACSYNKATEIPRYVLLAEEPNHATLTLKVNSQPFENGGIVMPHDTLFYQYVLDYGYEYDNGDTAYANSFVIERYMPQNDTLRIPSYSEYMRIIPPMAMVEMLDSTTAHITWTGIFTESKVLITPVELNQDPRYAKGFTFVNGRELTVDTLTPGQIYYLYIVGTKPEMSEVFETTFKAIYTKPEDFNWEPADDCEFTITMSDRWGDGWNGNALRFVEDGNVQTITLPSGSSGTAIYQSSAKPVSIYWVKGAYADEVSCTVADATGRPLLTINPGDAEDFAPGQLLFRGTLCWACAAKVQSLSFDVDSADFRIDWTGPDGVSYDVAITQKSNPTDADLEQIAFRQDSTSYIWTGKQWMGYHAYVRAICDDTVPGQWAHALVLEGMDNPEPYARLHAKSITPDYTETGDMLTQAILGGEGSYFYPTLTYRLNLTDTVDAVFSFQWENLSSNTTYGVVVRDTAPDTNAPMEILHYFSPGDTLRNLVNGLYLIVMTEGQLDEYTLSFAKPKYLTAKPIELGYTETGDFTEALPWAAPLLSGACPTHLFSYTPTDSVVNVFFDVTTNATISFSSMPSMAYFVFQDTLDLNHLLAAYVVGSPFTAELQKGHTYYFAVCLCPDAGGLLTDDYTVTLKQAKPLTAKTITLPYSESGDYTDAVEWTNPYFGMATTSKAFVFTPTDTVDVLIRVSGDNAPSAAGIFTFRGNFDHMIGAEVCPTITQLTCLKDSTYIFILSSLPMYGGKPTDTYQISFSELTEKTEPKVTAVLEPDTIVSGLLTEDDFVSSSNQLVRVYEYVAYKDTKVALGLFLTDTLPGMGDYMPFYGRVYKDTLNLNSFDYTYFDDDMSTLTMAGSAEGTHYYIAIFDYSGYSLSGLPFNLHFRREMDYDNPNVLATVELGQLYTSEMTLFDEFTYHDMRASAQSFRFHAEKGKNYKLYMHNTYCRYNTNEIAISVLNPSRKKGTYGGNLVSGNNGEMTGWFVTNFTPDSTGDYVVMFEHQLFEDYMVQDTLRYEFLITDYIEFIDLINSAEYVATPYIESGSYTSASTKVLYNETYKFQDPSYDNFRYYGGTYNAKAYMVIVPAGDTLLIEHVGDKDVMVYIYDFSSEDNAKNPYVIDNEGEGYPFEIGIIVNTNRMAKMYYVVITEYDTELDGGEWSLRIELGLKHIRQQDIAKGVASQDKITIYNNQGELEAIAALSALDLSAVDAATGATIGSIRNNSAYWQVDLLNNKARFEANESDLPVGYRFAEATEWIEVAIEVLPYGEGIDNVDEDKTFEVRKFLYNGHIYIQTPNGIFNITGQRVK